MKIIRPSENVLYYTKAGIETWEVSKLPEGFDTDGYSYQARNLDTSTVMRCKDLKTLRHNLKIHNKRNSQWDFQDNTKRYYF